MIVNIENTHGSFTVSHYTEEGDLNFLKIPVPKALQFTWQKTSANDKNKDKEWESWDGFPIKKVQTTKPYFEPLQTFYRLQILMFLKGFLKPMHNHE